MVGGGRMSSYREITNTCTRPYIAKKVPYSWNATGTQRVDDEIWEYTVTNPVDFVRATVGCWQRSPSGAVVDVIVIVYESPNPGLLVGMNAGGQYCMRGTQWIIGGTISDTIAWNACRIDDPTSVNHEFVIHVDAEPVVLLGYALYKADEWPIVEQLVQRGKLPAAWFAPSRDLSADVRGTPNVIPASPNNAYPVTARQP